jgi:hypothetical protein
MNGVDDFIEILVLQNSGGSVDLLPFSAYQTFTAHLITGQSSGGGTGGGSYTPENMVWEDKLSERTFDTVYTNTNDVPLYVQVYLNSQSGGTNVVECFIDNKRLGGSGGSGTGRDVYDNPLYIVPAGSTYELRKTGTCSVYQWNEARMPVAVGTGGKAVAFRGETSSKQTAVTATWTKINFDTTSIDTDNAFVDGKFQPSIAGYYQVNGSVGQACTPASVRIDSGIYKNGTRDTYGIAILSDGSYISNCSNIIYLNGTTDYVEFWGKAHGTGTIAFESAPDQTYLSAVLVSGGSASGDSVRIKSLESRLATLETRIQTLETT